MIRNPKKCIKSFTSEHCFQVNQVSSWITIPFFLLIWFAFKRSYLSSRFYIYLELKSHTKQRKNLEIQMVWNWNEPLSLKGSHTSSLYRKSIWDFLYCVGAHIAPIRNVHANLPWNLSCFTFQTIELILNANDGKFMMIATKTLFFSLPNQIFQYKILNRQKTFSLFFNVWKLSDKN